MDRKNVQFILRRLYYEFELPMHYYSAEGILECACGYPGNMQDPFMQDAKLYEMLKTVGKQFPELVQEDWVLYGVLSTENGETLIVGPVSVQEMSPLQFAGYCKKHSLDKNKFFICRNNLLRVANLLSILMFCLKNIKMDEEEILKKTAVRWSCWR